MKLIFAFLALLSFSSVAAQYQGPVAPISSGYGADGDFSVVHLDIRNDYNSILKPISLFYPEDATGPVPTVFYSHGYLSSDTSFHIETLTHIASKGYAVVFVPYRAAGITIAERYLTLFEGFVKAARSFPAIIDTTRVGFYGQSFGGGATPRLAYRAFTENSWGENGRFIFCSAPWYSFELGTTDLPNFPVDCSMLTVLYNDDFTNDHRLGMDVFKNIAVPDSLKDCLMVYSDTIGGYTYEADHSLPSQYTNSGEFDALDYYVTFRLLDALAEYAFTGSLVAKNVALGNGSFDQLYMGGQLSNLMQTDTPVPAYPESVYTNPCSDSQNERIAFCAGVSLAEEQEKSALDLLVYPNPSSGVVTLSLAPFIVDFEVTIHALDGKEVLKSRNKKTIDVAELNAGLYLVSVDSYTTPIQRVLFHKQ